MTGGKHQPCGWTQGWRCCLECGQPWPCRAAMSEQDTAEYLDPPDDDGEFSA